MPAFNQSILIIGGINLLLFVVALFDPIAFIWLFGVCMIEFVFGLLALIHKDTREAGKGMILCSLCSILIGQAVCSAMWKV